MVQSVTSTGSNPLNQLNDDSSFTYQQAEQAEQNLLAYIKNNNIAPNSGLGNLIEKISIVLQMQLQNPNSFDGAACLAEIQNLLSGDENGTDVYLSSNNDLTQPLLNSQSQIQAMITAMFQGIQPSPSITVPAPTIGDITKLNIETEIMGIQLTPPGPNTLNTPDNDFEKALAAAASQINSDTSQSDLYNLLKGIPTEGVDPSIVSWYNSLLAGLQPSK